MSDYSERLLADAPRKNKVQRLRLIWLVLIPLVAILFQAYVSRFFHQLSYLELPLLITVHFALSERRPIPALCYGAVIGMVQDSLSNQPIGMYGIVKTLVGYFAASVSLRFDVENPVVTFFLTFFFYFFHEFLHWVEVRMLLPGQLVGFDPQQTVIFGLLNAAVSVPLYLVLDKLKVAA
jgi:rod shape-determining protein MreD